MEIDTKEIELGEKLHGEMECLSKADGSSRFSINDTIQMCAVYGPGEVKIMKELADRAYVNVTYKPRIGNATNKEKVTEYTIRSICDGVILTHLHPRTAVNIIIQELQNDGSTLACSLNAACLALLDANIPLRYTFAAVTCGLIGEEKKIIYFPTLKQEKEVTMSMTFLFDSVDKEIISVLTNGIFEKDQLNYLLDNARQYANENIFPLYTELVSKKYFK